jgi:hypothetical protein
MFFPSQFAFCNLQFAMMLRAYPINSRGRDAVICGSGQGTPTTATLRRAVVEEA